MIALLLLASAHAAPLMKLIEKCPETAMDHGGCGNIVKPVWRRFEAANGEITKLDMSSIKPTTQGGVMVTTYTYSPGSYFDLTHLRVLILTCHGQFADLDDLTHFQDAPPRSVIGAIASTACAIGLAKRPPLPKQPSTTKKPPKAKGPVIIYHPETDEVVTIPQQ